MSILSQIFGNRQPQQLSPAQGANPAIQQQVAQANQPTTPGNIPAVNPMPADPNNPTVPLNQQTPQNPTSTTPEPQGMDKYKDLWNIAPESMPKDPVSPFAAITPDAINTIAGKLDFAKVITPEMMTQISAGGEGATAAMMQALDLVAKASYSESTQSAMKLIDVALSRQREEFTAALPKLIKNQNVADTLRSSNPIFNHPAAAPMLEKLQEQMAVKYPTASAEQLREYAQDFLVSFATSANPPKPDNSNKKVKNQEDWSDFL